MIKNVMWRQMQMGAQDRCANLGDECFDGALVMSEAFGQIAAHTVRCASGVYAFVVQGGAIIHGAEA